MDYSQSDDETTQSTVPLVYNPYIFLKLLDWND